MAKAKRIEIQFAPGTAPGADSTFLDFNSQSDDTSLHTLRCVDTDKIYFEKTDSGFCPRNIPFWSDPTGGDDIDAVSRNIFRYKDSTATERMLIGSTDGLYYSDGFEITNLTPLSATTTPIANSLDSTNGSNVMTVNAAAHGLTVGKRVKINAASNFGGWTASTQINIEHIVNTVPGSGQFTVIISSNASSSVTGGGGASTTYQKQIAMPSEFQTDDGSDPLIWSMALFGNDVVLTPGNQGGVYIWQNDPDVAPVLLSGAPAAVNWLYVANNAVHTLGASGQVNRIKTSDVGDATTWTISPATLAYEDDIEGFGRWISQESVQNNANILFTNDKVGLFRFVGLPTLYEFEELPLADGIIAAMARCATESGVFWMGGKDFYNYDGASITRLEGVTCHNTIFGSLYANLADQVHLAFAQHNPNLKHVTFHFNANDTSSGCDCYMIYDYKYQHSTLGKMRRSAGENPYYGANGNYFMIGETVGGAEDSRLYMHDAMIGDAQSFASNYEDDPTPISVLRTAYAMLGDGDTCMEIDEIVPDVSNVGFGNLTVNLTIYARDYPQQAGISTSYLFTDSTTKLDARIQGRQRAYKFSVTQSEAQEGTDFIFGKIIESVRVGSTR